MSHPLTPIEVSGTFEIPNEYLTQFFGDCSDITQKYTLTLPLPTNCTVEDGLVYVKGYVIGKVNESDPTKMNLNNVEILDSCIEDGEITFTCRIDGGDCE